MKSRLLFAAIALVPFSMTASVSISFNADTLRTSTGVAAPQDTLAMLIADADGLGFGALTPGSINQYDAIGSGDVVVARFDFSNFFTDGVISVDSTGIDLTGFSSNDQLAIAWFPGLTTASSSITEAQSYGLLTDVSWIVPTDGGANPEEYQVISPTNIFFGENSNTLNVTNLQSQANLTVNAVPEPQTYALIAGMVTLGLVAYRRKRS